MKNKKSTLLAVGLIFFGLLSCNSGETSEQTAIVENTAAPAATPVAEDIPPLSSIPESTSLPTASIPPPAFGSVGPLASTIAPLTSSAPVNTNGPVSTGTPQKAKSNVRLNPAHGQPGHDCAIAVGAPLKNSVAAKPAAAPVVNTVASSLPAIESTPLSGSLNSPIVNANPNAKINPAHGQPGHDCAVAVGAPLPVK